MIVICDMIYAISYYKRNYLQAIADNGADSFVVVFVLTWQHYLK